MQPNESGPGARRSVDSESSATFRVYAASVTLAIWTRLTLIVSAPQTYGKKGPKFLKPPKPVGVRRKHRYRPGTVALRDIKRYQRP